MSNLEPYLYFSGRCEEAIEFYCRALGAVLEMKMKFSENPTPIPAGVLQPGFESKIMHASLRIGERRVMMSDGCDDRTGFSGFRIAMTLTNAAEAHRLFDALAVDGHIDMPLSQTFWSPCYGMVTDKFKVGWMIMVNEYFNRSANT